MHHGTPEARLWAAVALTLINDCRDEIAEESSYSGIAKVAMRWRHRADEVSFRYIMDILDLPPGKLIDWIYRFEDRARTALHCGHWNLDAASWVSDQAIIGRGQKRAY